MNGDNVSQVHGIEWSYGCDSDSNDSGSAGIDMCVGMFCSLPLRSLSGIGIAIAWYKARIPGFPRKSIREGASTILFKIITRMKYYFRII